MMGSKCSFGDDSSLLSHMVPKGTGSADSDCLQELALQYRRLRSCPDLKTMIAVAVANAVFAAAGDDAETVAVVAEIAAVEFGGELGSIRDLLEASRHHPSLCMALHT